GRRLYRYRAGDLCLLASGAGAGRRLPVRHLQQPGLHTAGAPGAATARSLFFIAVPDDDCCARAGINRLGSATARRPGRAGGPLRARRALRRAVTTPDPRIEALFRDYPGHPYKKWQGAHWRLVSLVELALPRPTIAQDATGGGPPSPVRIERPKAGHTPNGL